MKKKLSLLCGGALLLSMLCASPVHAQLDDRFFKTEQHGIFQLRYLTKEAYEADMRENGAPESEIDAFDSSFKPGELKMLPTSFAYWSTMLAPYAKGTADLDIALLAPKDENASAESDPVKNGPFAGQTELTATLNGWKKGDDDVASLTLNHTSHKDGWFTGDMEALPQNGGQADLASTMLHEMAHALGIGALTESEGDMPTFENVPTRWTDGLRDIEGRQARPGMTIVSDSEAEDLMDKGMDRDSLFISLDKENYANQAGVGFTGKNVAEVLCGARIAYADGGPVLRPNYLPINVWEGDEAELSHIELQNSLMSHQDYRNWNTLMEAELAALQDAGLKLDRRDWYGYSIYHSGTEDKPYVFVNDNPYCARQNGVWVEGKPNDTPWGMGLHIYGSHTHVTQAADLLTEGDFGTGIRMDGVGSSLTVAPGVKVHADGYKGTGLMVSYGKEHEVILRGDVQALGEGGIGARFDFGSNELGNNAEYRGSWIRSSALEEDEMPEGSEDTDNLMALRDLLPALEGPLVDSFDVSGRLAGRKAAIYISENAHVGQINILNGSRIEGDIISKWDPFFDHVQYEGDRADLLTTLSFGLAADEDGCALEEGDSNFQMRYDGKIHAPKGMLVEHKAGTLSINGSVDVVSFSVADQAVLKGNTQYTLNKFDQEYGSFINAGTLAPGNSIGVISIKGDYMQEAGGLLSMEFDAAGEHDVLKVSGGTATLAGGLELSPVPDFYRSGSEVSVSLDKMLQFENPAAGELSLPGDVEFSSPTLQMSLAWDPAGKTCIVISSRDADAYAGLARNSNAQAVGRALDNAASSAGGIGDVYAGLDFSGSSEAVSSGLDQLSPSAYANAAKLMLDGQRLYSDLILNTTAPEGDGLWHVFVQPFGGYSDQSGESGWEAGRGGVIAGLERTESGSSVGAHIVFDHVSQNGDVIGHLRGEGLFLGLHGRWAPASWNGFHAFALGRAGFESMRMDRAFSFGPYSGAADSDWTGTAGSLRVGGGWDADFGTFSFGPFAQLDYAFNARPSVDEGGSPAALHLDSELFQSLRTGLGLRIVSKAVPLTSDLMLKAQASASWNHELLDKAGSFDASFRQARDASFSHDAGWEGRDSLGLSAGVSLDKGNGLSISFHGGAELFRHNASSLWGKASLNWKF